MSKSRLKITILKNKIEVATRHNQNYVCDLMSIEDAARETRDLIQRNNNFIRVYQKQLQDLKDQEFMRYLRTPCYRYNING